MRIHLALLLSSLWISGSAHAAQDSESTLSISLSAEGKMLPKSGNFRVPSSARDFQFLIEGYLGSQKAAAGRVRFKLEGYDTRWWELGADMRMNVRFTGDDRLPVTVVPFPVGAKSPGWDKDLEHSRFVHRRENLIVPEGARKLGIVITSAGPPTAMGVYAIANLVLRKYTAAGSVTTALLDFPTLSGTPLGKDATAPGWARDGTRPAMAQLHALDKGPTNYALCVFDDNISAHAEWRLDDPALQDVRPGELLTLEWDEAYSIGYGEKSRAEYRQLPSGTYRFVVNKVDVLGNPRGYETSVGLTVTAPFWKSSWFLATLSGLAGAIVLLIVRNILRRRMQREIEHLRQQHLLESERLRIARNIHDDLGARLTHISLASEMAGEEVVSVADAKVEFEKLSGMARDLVSALYETVWTVDPKNDSLQSLVDFLCETTQKLCDSTNIHCALDVCDIANDLQISSDSRHNVSLAVKEAVHNTIKHSKASEIVLHVREEKSLLVVEVRDNGEGFTIVNTEGHGLQNMRRRMELIGGTFAIVPQPGSGLTVRFEIPLPKGTRPAATA